MQLANIKERDSSIVNVLKKCNKNYESRQALVKPIKEVFDVLGYDLNGEFIYAETTYGRWNWRTTQNKYYTKKVYDFINKTFEYQNIYYNIDEKILPHCFPLELKNHKSVGTEAHYVNDTLCGAYVKKISDIMIIDIDCHDGNSQRSYSNLLTLIKHFDNYLYLEKSNKCGYHLYIKLDSQYSQEQKFDYFQKIKKQYDLKCVDLPTKIRFPFSYHYEPCNHHFDTFTVRESLSNIIPTYNAQEGFRLSGIQEVKRPQQLNVVSKIYSRKNRSNIQHITTEQYLQNTPLTISEGNRHLNMLEVCRISKFNNWSSQETLEVISNPLPI